jgi:MacB-like periplasmic core domain
VAQSLPLACRLGTSPSASPVSLPTPTLFKTLGTRFAPGRCLSDEADPRRRNIAVIGDGLWRDYFGARPETVGQIIQVESEPFEVVGIAPPGFRGAQRDERPDIWLPLHSAASVIPDMKDGRFGSRRWTTNGVSCAGIRMALRARRGTLLSRVLGRGLLLTGGGLLAGGVLAAALGRLIAGLLYQISRVPGNSGLTFPEILKLSLDDDKGSSSLR